MLLQLLKKGLAPYGGWLVAIVVFQFIGTLAMLYLPSLNADIIDEGVSKGDTAFIIQTGSYMLLISLVQIVCAVVAVYYGARVAMRFGFDLRRRLFANVGSFSSSEINHFGAPSLITRATNDVQQVQMLVLTTATMMVSAPIMMLGGILMAMQEDFGLSWLLAVAVPVLLFVLLLIGSQMIPGFRLMQSRIDAVNRVLREQITGIRVVRAFTREPEENRRFDEANDELMAVAISTGRWMAALPPAIMLVLNASMVAVIWFGGLRVDAGEVQVGALIAFMAYLMQILMSAMMAAFALIMVPRASVCADRIGEVLETKASVVAPVEPIVPETINGVLEFRSVEFSYPGAEKPVLSQLDFRAVPGTTTAIIGATGSGKSTLASLVPRLFDVTEGKVLLDNIDIRQLAPENLRAAIGLVPQKAFLFAGTVASNLRYAKPETTDEELWRVLEIAQAADFVRQMPEGLDASITQGGSNVSGGQRQRLAIARAVLRQCPIYIFDDAFSALDLGTEMRLRRALMPVLKHATVLVIAQRVSSIRHADQILVLDNGRLVGCGTHQQLLASNGTYQEIVSSQLSVEEAV